MSENSATPLHIKLPNSHNQRHLLNDELHQHPYESLRPPERVICIGMRVNPEQRPLEVLHLQCLLEHFGHSLEMDSNRIRCNLGSFRFKMEMHHEITRYKFIFTIDSSNIENPFAGNPLDQLPKGWLSSLPGETLTAMDLAILPCPGNSSPPQIIEQYSKHFTRQPLIASLIGRSGGMVITDFAIRNDSMLRMLVFSKATLPSQNGRLILRLIEIETYRMQAMLVVPDARIMLRKLPQFDARLTELTDAISRESGRNDEQLLDELSSLAAHIESLVASSYRRLSASRAYFNLVSQRLNDLHEQPIERLPSLGGILNRRLEPARMTCDSVSHWLEQLSQRVAQTSQLLRTRVDVGHEKQSQKLLKAMNDRFYLQLRLQSAAEMLSVAIFSFYTVGLLSYIGEEAALLLSMTYNPILFKAVAVPLVAGSAILFVLRLRKKRTIEST